MNHIPLSTLEGFTVLVLAACTQILGRMAPDDPGRPQMQSTVDSLRRRALHAIGESP